MEKWLQWKKFNDPEIVDVNAGFLWSEMLYSFYVSSERSGLINGGLQEYVDYVISRKTYSTARMSRVDVFAMLMN